MENQPDRRALLKNALTAINTLQKKLDTVEQAQREPIAIVGMSCRFPGGIDSPEAYWDLLASGGDTVTHAPRERWSVELDEGIDDSTWHGSFVNNIDQFDPQFFGITPREATTMDPQQRLVLEVTWEALERAGIAPDTLKGSQTGIYIGITTNDYGHIGLSGDPTKLDVYTATGSALNVAPGRVAYTLGLQGPSMAIDTACSSSLVAIHLACHSLRTGETNMALVGGVNALLKPEAFICFTDWGMMAPDGRCKTFDERADGFVRGEGCGMVVLKRLSDAQADGDNILAVIRGSAVNQDGRSSGLTVPNGRSQRAVIEQALASAKLKPADISYVEAHGTGTTLGDPIEVEAIGDALRKGRSQDQQPLFLSSVKTNIGHLESASGIAGLMKVVLALQHQEIPGHLHLQERSSRIPWPSFPVEIPTENTPWPAVNNQRLAGVSSFGFSGTNGHVILGEAPDLVEVDDQEERSTHILTLSAKTGQALRKTAVQLIDYLTYHPDVSLTDLTYTMNSGRAQFNKRAAIVGNNVETLQAKLTAFANLQTGDGIVQGEASGTPQTAFLFTGQGSQVAGMGQELFNTEPVFRETLTACADILQPHLDKPLLSIIFPETDSDADLINQTQYTQPALFALEYSLAKLWQSWGVVPTAVMGHSVGEYVAACIAGVFSLEDGLRLIAARGRLMGSLPAGGAMAAVFADEIQVHAAIADYAEQVSIAAVNGPTNIVISGEETAVSAILEQLASKDIKAKALTVSHAFHSPLMDSILAEFATIAAGITYSEPQISLISNVSGKLAGAEVTTAAYWRDHIRQAVRFADSMTTLAEQGYTIFLECGPKPTLLGMAQRCLPDPSVAAWIPSLRPGKNDSTQILVSLGELFAHGVTVDWPAFYGSNQNRLVLPTYPFQRKRYWLDVTKQKQARRRKVLHPLLHDRLQSPLLPETVFTANISIHDPAYLDDHRVFDVPLFPGTGHLEVAMAAAIQAFAPEQVELTNLQIQDALVLPEEGEKCVQVAVSPWQDGQATVRIFSQDDRDAWTQHATAIVISASQETPSFELAGTIQARCSETITAVSYYQKLTDIGLNYGYAFRGIQSINRRDGEAIGLVVLPAEMPLDTHHLHPALLDACFQLIGVALPEAEEDEATVFVPVGIDHFRLFQSGKTAVTCHVQIESGADQADVKRASIHLLDEAGQPVALVGGIRIQRISRLALQQATKRPFANLLYEVTWQATPTADTKTKTMAGHWLILADQQGIGKAAAAELENVGATTAVVSSSAINLLDPEAYNQLIAEQPPLSGVLHFWGIDAESAHLDQSQEISVGSALYLVKALLQQQIEPNIWFFTQGAQAVLGAVPQPTQASLWGFANTLASEQPALHPVICDLDAIVSTQETAKDILTELQSEDSEDRIVWRNRTRYVARLTPYESGTNSLDIPQEQAFELFTPQQGILDNIKVRSKSRQQPQSNEIEIAVKATGLNFRDVLNALGMYPGPAGALGNECVGVVTAVGAGVTHFAEGDTVMTLGAGTFASHITTKAGFASHTPTNLTLTESATIPITFLTAYYGLHELAHMKAGDRILIHAAAGGVGMAAVQLAQAAGATIFGTAGTPEKRAYLKSLGVPHVMNSRTLDFADEIMEITDGTGVDIVLNALADEFIPKSFSVLADNGRFLEIGKRGVWTTEQVAAFNPTLDYYLYDLADVLDDTPTRIGDMLNSLKFQFERGDLQPLPTHIFPMSQAIDAFRFMSQARHIGKIVISQGNKLEAPIRSDGTYLITGGTGGLGLAIAQGLVDKGAQHILLLSRRTPSAAVQAKLDQLNANGATITAVQADVSQEADVQQIITHIAEAMPPLRGIVHAAGTLDDAMLPHQSWDKFQKVMAAKVTGTWTLNKLTQACPLDFFVMFSAGAAMLGSPGQINYSSANAFMDGIAAARHAKRLPALSISWGAWDEVGMAANLDERTRKQWQASGVGLLSPDEGVALFFQLLAQAPTQVGVLPMDWRQLAQQNNNLEKRPFFSQVLPKSTDTQAGKTAVNDSLLIHLEAASADEQLEILQTYVQEQVIQVLGLDTSQAPDARQGLTDIGMDSLMAVELSNRLQAGVQQSLPTTLAFEYPTIEALTTFLATDIITLQPIESEKVEDEEAVEAQDAILAEIEELSEDETEDSLLKELEDAGY